MRITVRTNSETYARIIKGLSKYGQDEYRHCYNRAFYFIVDAKAVDKNHVELLLQEV